MAKRMNLSLKKIDYFILLFSFLWIALVLLDYLNKHPIYIESIQTFSYPKLTLFFIALGALITFIYTKRQSLGKLKQYLFSILIILSVPISILAISISFSKYHSEPIETYHHFYLLFNSCAVLLGGILILFSSYSIGNKISEAFLDKKVIMKSHFTLQLCIGIVVTTLLTMLCGALNLLNTWTALGVILIPMAISCREAFSGLKNAFKFEPDLRAIDMILIMVMLFFCTINFVSILGPFPLGFDSRNLYMNIPKIIAHNGGLVSGFQPHNWELYSSLGLIMANKIEITMFMYQVAGILTGMAAYYSAQSIFKLSRTSSLLICAVLLLTPAISRQMYTELKIDLGLLFFQLVTLQFYISYAIYKGKSSKAIYIFCILMGILLGFGMGIKLLHFFLIFGLFVAMSFDRETPAAVWAVSLIMLGGILFLRLDDQTGLRPFHKWADMLSYAFIVGGVILTILSFLKNLDFSKKLITHLVIISAFTLMTFSPWVILNYGAEENASLMNLLRGGSGGHDLDQTKLKEIYDRLTNQGQ